MPKLFNTILSVLKSTPASNPDADHLLIYGNSSDELFQRNSAGSISKITNDLIFFNALSVNFPAIAQVNTTRVPVTSWSFNVVAGKSYLIKVLATYQSVIATTGGSMGFTTSGGAVGTIRGYFAGDITNTATAAGFRSPLSAINTIGTTVNSFLTTTGTTLGQSQCFNVEAVFNCTTSGSVVVNWGTEISGSRSFLQAGSALIVNVLN
jgi:hypothetical protein